MITLEEIQGSPIGGRSQSEERNYPKARYFRQSSSFMLRNLVAGAAGLLDAAPSPLLPMRLTGDGMAPPKGEDSGEVEVVPLVPDWTPRGRGYGGEGVADDGERPTPLPLLAPPAVPLIGELPPFDEPGLASNVPPAVIPSQGDDGLARLETLFSRGLAKGLSTASRSSHPSSSSEEVALARKETDDKGLEPSSIGPSPPAASPRENRGPGVGELRGRANAGDCSITAWTAAALGDSGGTEREPLVLEPDPVPGGDEDIGSSTKDDGPSGVFLGMLICRPLLPPAGEGGTAPPPTLTCTSGGGSTGIGQDSLGSAAFF